MAIQQLLSKAKLSIPQPMVHRYSWSLRLARIRAVRLDTRLVGKATCALLTGTLKRSAITYFIRTKWNLINFVVSTWRRTWQTKSKNAPVIQRVSEFTNVVARENNSSWMRGKNTIKNLLKTVWIGVGKTAFDTMANFVD